MKKLGDLSIRTKLLAALLITQTLAILVVGWQGYSDGKDAIARSWFNQLTALRESKAHEVERYFEEVQDNVILLSSDWDVKKATKALRDAFRDVDTAVPRDDADARRLSLRAYYESNFWGALDTDFQQGWAVDAFLPTSSAATYLQHQYIVANPHPDGAKENLVRVEDDLVYNTVHAAAHPIFQSFLHKHGYADLYLIDVGTGNVVYSTQKRVDFGADLMQGAAADSPLAHAYKSAPKSTRFWVE